MVWFEIIFGAVLVVVLLGLSVHFGRQQLQALRELRLTPNLPDEEKRYEGRKAYRRLVSCSLTLLLAILLVVLLVCALPVQEIADQRKGFDAESAPAIPDEQRPVLRLWGWTLISFLLVLMVVLLLAGIDLMATRWYAMRQFRKLQADRRAMIERQAQRMRHQRNGHG